MNRWLRLFICLEELSRIYHTLSTTVSAFCDFHTISDILMSDFSHFLIISDTSSTAVSTFSRFLHVWNPFFNEIKKYFATAPKYLTHAVCHVKSKRKRAEKEVIYSNGAQ